MDELTDQEFEAANERGRVHFETEPHAKSASYDANTGIVTVDLFNGCRFMFPARELQGLERASDEQLAEVEVLGVGFGLHWESLDADFTVPGLLAGRFGNKKHMEARHARLRAILADMTDEHRQAA